MESTGYPNKHGKNANESDGTISSSSKASDDGTTIQTTIDKVGDYDECYSQIYIQILIYVRLPVPFIEH